jgi:hypothetical protein
MENIFCIALSLLARAISAPNAIPSGNTSELLYKEVPHMYSAIKQKPNAASEMERFIRDEDVRRGSSDN